MHLIDLLSPDKKRIFEAVKKNSEELLDCSPKFKFFTLHGKIHIENMIGLADSLIEGGLNLTSEDAFLLSIAICVHDLGMIIPLKDVPYTEILKGRQQVSDTASIENLVREYHHELINSYMAKNFGFLTSLGISPSDCGLIEEIAKSHRKTNLSSQRGCVKYLGALLRVLDEFDIGSTRAPIGVFRQNYEDMDGNSCWHWFKHNIVDTWRVGHNVNFITKDIGKIIQFKLIVRPSKTESIPYWLKQISRPMLKVLKDEGAASIIKEKWNIIISLAYDFDSSKAVTLGKDWELIETKSLSHGRKVILVVDDEVRKMEDLFIPLMNNFYVLFSPNARDALTKISATKVDLAIIDLQVGSGDLWGAEETHNYKQTGKKLCEEINLKYTETKVGILSGTRHDVNLEGLRLEFFFKKPVDPEKFEEEVNAILEC